VQNTPGPLCQSSSLPGKSLEFVAARKNTGPAQRESTYLLAPNEEKATTRQLPQCAEKNIAALTLANVGIALHDGPLIHALGPWTALERK